jgi:hypothetical protein
MDIASKIAHTVRNVVRSVGIASNRSPWLIAAAILTFFLFV